MDANLDRNDMVSRAGNNQKRKIAKVSVVYEHATENVVITLISHTRVSYVDQKVHRDVTFVTVVKYHEYVH